MIKDYFLNYEAMNNDFTIQLGRESRISYEGSHTEQDFHVTLADTGLASMTGGRIKRVRRYLANERFMVTYGDGVSDINLDCLLEFHRNHGRLATVTTVRPPSRFGIVDLDEEGQIRRFAEKPQSDSWASSGFFIFEPGVMDYLGGDDCVLEARPLERLAADGQLMAYRHDGFFYPMDTYREHQHLNHLWETGRAPWKVWR